MRARRSADAATRVSAGGLRRALAIRGLPIAASALRRIAGATIAVASAPSAARSRRIARACSCETRDSFTPSSAPMSFIVTSL